MKSEIKEILSSMSLEEKNALLTGHGSMSTAGNEKLKIKAKRFADGPCGVRGNLDDDCTQFPSLCLLGATWDTLLAKKMGKALAAECTEHGIDMLLAPGINIKRHILCGRNFEYISEDPVLSGEIAAAYINGLQSGGVGACLKHFAVNNQEKDRLSVSVDVDIQTLMEIYLKGFEIAIKKSNPKSVMCSYNKLHSIWCSENKFLLTDVLRDMWGYEGITVSDWGAVQNSVMALKAGLDIQMPENPNMQKEITEGLKRGDITEGDIDTAAGRMIKFLLDTPVKKATSYDRNKQHEIAADIAATGVVLLKNDNQTLPITPDKYKKIAVIGEFALNPLISGQGSAEVLVSENWISSPFKELLKECDGKTEVKYLEMYKKASFSSEMLWPKISQFNEFISDADFVLMFVGAMESEDTENFDRRTAELNPNYEMFIDAAVDMKKKVAVINQSGSAMIFGGWRNRVDSIVQMWLSGEGAGKAIADVLCGNINPSGKLSETFSVKMRTDLPYPGDGNKIEYTEKRLVGYRYFDKHPEEIMYPFGHGLSYTTFEYSNLDLLVSDEKIKISFEVENTGKISGAEVCQIYVGNPYSDVIKELKAFKKLSLNCGERKKMSVEVLIKDIGYFNVLLREWVTEAGEYTVYVGSSSRDIRLTKKVFVKGNAPYTMKAVSEGMIG